MTACLADRDFDEELGAVWYAANYYYKESYQAGVEYGGVVFKNNAGKYSFSIRKDNSFHSSNIRWEDVENTKGNIPTAIWHTHLPYTACKSDFLTCVSAMFSDALLGDYGYGFESFSGADKELALKANAAGMKIYNHRIAIYFVTGTLIRRYDPRTHRIKSWKKPLQKI